MTKEELQKVPKGGLLVVTNGTPEDNIVGKTFIFDHLDDKNRVVFIAYYDPVTDDFFVNPNGKMHLGKGDSVRLATISEELIFDKVASNLNYSWDNEKKELICSARPGNPHVDADGLGILLIRDLSGQQKYVIKELIKSWNEKKDVPTIEK